MLFVFTFLISFVLALAATVLAKKMAVRFGILDVPERDLERKVHKNLTPLLGGLALIATFNAVSVFLYLLVPVVRENLPLRSMAAIWAGSLILAIGGLLDDVKNLKSWQQFIFPVLAVLAVLFSGMNVPHITNPLGGKFELTGIMIGGVSLLSAAFVFLWLMGMIYTSKLLDGLDGLDTSIGLVAALTLFALSFTPQVLQDYTAMLAIALAGTLAGFLVFNWHPAKIFLGESGSTFIGFILGILSIIAGGKVATAFLVMGIPILDVAWVILRRLYYKRSPFRADRLHLHFRLLDLGLSHRQTVGVFVLFSAVFGGTAVLLQSFGKFVSVLVLLLVMMAFGLFVVYLTRRKKRLDQNSVLS